MKTKMDIETETSNKIAVDLLESCSNVITYVEKKIVAEIGTLKEFCCKEKDSFELSKIENKILELCKSGEEFIKLREALLSSMRKVIGYKLNLN